jgi:hypothetical protein
MSVQQSVEWELAGETEVLGENLPQCYDVLCGPQIPHDLTRGSNTRRRGGKPAANRLYYRTAYLQVFHAYLFMCFTETLAIILRFFVYMYY